MGLGSNRAILRVDLTSGTTTVETYDEAFLRTYPGGKALAAYHLLREMPAGADPLGPDNVLVLATGLLTGAPVSTATRFNAIARSPLTGGFGESEAGGYWGPELKMAGLDAVILTGRSPHPVWIWIRDGKAEIRDAADLWGQDPPFVQDTIRAQTGEKNARVLQIGRAGENLVPYAMLMNDLRHYNGRTGMGAVMGSKNVRAIAVKGSSRYLNLAHDSAALGKVGKSLADRVTEHPQSWDLRTKGTPGLTDGLNAAGILPTRNFRQGSFEQVEGIGWAAFESIRSATRTCYACTVRCKPETAFEGRYRVTDTYDGPEYEAIAGFGSNCAIFDIQLVAKANELCNEVGLDVISTAGTVAFVMECVEHGLLDVERDLGGLDLRFGNGEAVLQAIPMIADREGVGALLALGSRAISQRVGGGSEAWAMQVKGLELAMHEPRGKVGVALGYATNEAGADHLVAFHDPIFVNPESVAFKGAIPLGITEPSPARDLGPNKVKIWYTGERWNNAEKVLGLCFFGPAPRSFLQVDDVLAAVRSATGWDVTVDELLEMGERAMNLARLFNIREGIDRRFDKLPERLHLPLEGGPLTGVSINRDEFEAAVSALYTLKGWDPATGIPTDACLQRLGLDWARDGVGAAPAPADGA